MSVVPYLFCDARARMSLTFCKLGQLRLSRAPAPVKKKASVTSQRLKGWSNSSPRMMKEIPFLLPLLFPRLPPHTDRTRTPLRRLLRAEEEERSPIKDFLIFKDLSAWRCRCTACSPAQPYRYFLLQRRR